MCERALCVMCSFLCGFSAHTHGVSRVESVWFTKLAESDRFAGFLFVTHLASLQFRSASQRTS